MQVEAIYHQGQIRFKRPLRFKYDDFSITVILPEEAIAVYDEITELPATVSDAAHSMLDRIKNILGEHFHHRPEASIQQDREALFEALEEKYLR